MRSTQRASHRWTFTPAQPDHPATSLRDIVSGAYTRGIDFRPIFESTNLFTLLRLVETGLGLSVLPRIATAQLDMREVRAIRLGKSGMFRRIGIATLNGKAFLPPAASFHRLMRSLPEMFAGLQKTTSRDGIDPRSRPISDQRARGGVGHRMPRGNGGGMACPVARHGAGVSRDQHSLIFAVQPGASAAAQLARKIPDPGQSQRRPPVCHRSQIA
ncbi:MAG: hypothetical protein HIU82_15520 [Proteobacteria bacterium]|nr:hypothetical protein [Pseudomonadota bacterium]